MTRTHRTLAIASLALLSAALMAVCSPSRAQEVRAVRVDGFTAYERALVLRAVNDWNVALNGRVRLEIVDGGAANISISAMHGQLPSFVGGKTLAQASFVFVDNLDRCPLDYVARHEIGHALGLLHSGRGVMRPVCDSGQARVTADDARALFDHQVAKVKP